VAGKQFGAMRVGLGKKSHSAGLVPVETDLPPAPKSVLRLISCTCKKCERVRGCRRAGIECSPFCSPCPGISCSNIESIRESEEEDDLDELLIIKFR